MQRNDIRFKLIGALVAGHCDTKGTVSFNQPLSEERAGVAHAMLVGDRDNFIKLCDGRHDEIDVTQIFDWTTRAYGFTCKPTTLTAKPSDERYRQFREAYNNWLDAWDPSTEPDSRGGPKLSPAGRLDPTIWGAIFDLYEHNLRQELGEDAAGVADLRGQIVWVDPNRQSLGFSEHHPIDNLGRDNYRSQANRRVEILFFDPGEEPDLDLGGGAPEMSDIYLPGHYNRKHLSNFAEHLEVKITTIEGLYAPDYNAPGEIAPKLSGYKKGYISEDDGGRIFLNHFPRTDPNKKWDDVRTKDVQYIELCVEVIPVGGKIPPGTRVEWEWFDPDDPSNEKYNIHNHAAKIVDENDDVGAPRAQDNRGTCDYPSPGDTGMARFEKVDIYDFANSADEHIADTDVVEGKSVVRLHVSNIGGDNFIVVARIKKSPVVKSSNEIRTGVMTVWKRIDVEYVRMKNALPLPVDKVPPYFEPAFVQMDFAKERLVDSIPFLTTKDKNKKKASSKYANAPPNGEFQNEGKPGWFFLAAAERFSSENIKPKTPPGVPTGPKFVYEGIAKVESVINSKGNWEKLVVDDVISGKISFLYLRDKKGAKSAGQLGVWKKEVIGGKTHLHLSPLDYASDFIVPKGQNTGLIGSPGKGGAYDIWDYYYPRHCWKQPSNTWEMGGLGFPKDVYFQGKPPGWVETSGVSPNTIYGGREYFSGKLLIFTRAHDAETIDENDALSTIVHEFTHAFGYPHKCGYYSWQAPPAYSCSLNYFSTWLYAIGTRNLQRFVYGKAGIHLCARHLHGVREVNLEDNPAMWNWATKS